MMGGTLELQSTPGQGSVFPFSLQLRKGQVIDRDAGGQIRYIAGTHVLIVDDNAANR